MPIRWKILPTVLLAAISRQCEAARILGTESTGHESCATAVVQDATRCGVDHVKNMIEDGARCGWTTCYQDIPWVGRQSFPCPKQCEHEEDIARSCEVKTDCRYRVRVWLEGVVNIARPAEANLTLNYVNYELLDGSSEVKAVFAAKGAVDGILGGVVKQLEQEGNRRLGLLTGSMQDQIVEQVSGQMHQLDSQLADTLGGTDAVLAMRNTLHTVIPEATAEVDIERRGSKPWFDFDSDGDDDYDYSSGWDLPTDPGIVAPDIDFEKNTNVTASVVLPGFRSVFNHELCKTAKKPFQCKIMWNSIKYIVWSSFPDAFTLPVPDGMQNVTELEANMKKYSWFDELIYMEHLPWNALVAYLRSVLLVFGKALPVDQPASIVDATLNLVPLIGRIRLAPTSWVEVDGSVKVGR